MLLLETTLAANFLEPPNMQAARDQAPICPPSNVRRTRVSDVDGPREGSIAVTIGVCLYQKTLSALPAARES